MIKLEEIQSRFPFLTGLRHQNREYIGIVQNTDDKILSFYDYEVIKTPDEKKLFLELGELWWWQSNRSLPIQIFLQGQMTPYRYCLKTIINKDIEILFGPVTSLNNIIKKRIKKRQIELFKKTD
jgi:hypothetical protein